MTAETSNARGDSRPGIDRLWDSQWVNIVNSPEVLEAMGFRDCEEAVNIAVRMTEQAMAKNFAAARGDVRGLVSLAKRVQYADTHAQVSEDDAGEFVCLPPWLWLEIRDAAAEALAAEGVQAGEVDDSETAWREGWAMAYSGAGHLYGDDGELQDNRWPCIDWRRDNALEIRRKIEERGNRAWQAQLSQQPEALGVVDEAMVERAWVAFCENNGSARQGIRAAVTAALTEARNVR